MIHSVPETTSVALSVGQGVRDRSGAKANSESTDVQEKKSAIRLASPSERGTDSSEIQSSLRGQTALGAQEAEAAKDVSTISQDLKDKVALIQNSINQIDSQVQFSVEEDLDRVVVKVVERETGELIRQIPSEEVLRAQRFLEEQPGILFEEEA